MRAELRTYKCSTCDNKIKMPKGTENVRCAKCGSRLIAEPEKRRDIKMLIASFLRR